MKNLHLASDEDIYRMRDNITIFVGLSYGKRNTFQNMKKELDKEFIRRGLDKQVIPLSWDLTRS